MTASCSDCYQSTLQYDKAEETVNRKMSQIQARRKAGLCRQSKPEQTSALCSCVLGKRIQRSACQCMGAATPEVDWCRTEAEDSSSEPFLDVHGIILAGRAAELTLVLPLGLRAA